MTEFSSAFGERIISFLDYRAARGFKRETYIRHFIKFDRWCAGKHPEKTELSRELVLGWIDDATVSDYNTAQRVAAMRQFARYLCANGEEAYILPEKYAPLRSRSAAYLFTDAELAALFRAVDHLPPTRKEPFLNETAPVLFRLIYTCGLRPNEGRELLAENVNLETGEILITHTKRNKERFVVMSDDMLAFAHSYELRREIFGAGNPYFFPSADGGELETATVYSAFNRAWSHADLSGKYPGKVRVYDLRHRFASACLNRWLDNGENLLAMLPFLREYMGHSSLSETAYFMRHIFICKIFWHRYGTKTIILLNNFIYMALAPCLSNHQGKPISSCHHQAKTGICYKSLSNSSFNLVFNNSNSSFVGLYFLSVNS